MTDADTYISSFNRLLNNICEIEDYLIFKLLPNKTYENSLNELVYNYLNLRGIYPKAVVINDIDLEHFTTSNNLNTINFNIKFVIASELIKDYLNKQFKYE